MNRLVSPKRPLARLKRKLAVARSLGPGTLVKLLFQRVWGFSALSRAYYGLRYWQPIWLYVLNRRGKRWLAKSPPRLDALQQQAVGTLREKGICVMPLSDLWGTEAPLEELLRERDRVLADPSVSAQTSEGHSAWGKDFVIRCLGEDPPIDLSSPFVRLALDDRVLDIVNTYMGLYSRLTYVDMWFNLPVPESQARVASQGWHRDYDDKRVMKLFVYLVDVDEKRGPFTYLEESQPGGVYARKFPRPPGRFYPDNDAVESAIPPSAVRTCTGKAGTAILVDTAGLHRGGRTVSDPRIVFTAFYQTDAAYATGHCRLIPGEDYESLSLPARYALRLDPA